MLLFVIIFNLVITGINCYLVIKLWQLYSDLKEVTHQLTKIERQIPQTLALIREQIFGGQQKTAQLRELYQQFLRQVVIAQRLFRRLKWLWKVWYRIQN
ncbi:MAG: hypothetical protein QNJ42_22885 [Crocosphaera sp.]|nr:hypothetical protein [Crocosphaera sp.]